MAHADVDRLVIDTLAEERAEYEAEAVAATANALTYRLMFLTCVGLVLEQQDENHRLERRLKSANEQIQQLMHIEPPREADDGR